MLDFEEAVTRLTSSVSRLDRERISLFDADGRVLAETLVAPAPMPAFDYSALDGYTLSAHTFTGAGPWEFPVIGESRTGVAPAALTPGSACRIFTGAELPAGADTVVAQEVVTVNGGRARFTEPATAWANVRRRGEDLQPGELVLTDGTRLGPSQLGLIAALDRAAIFATRRPRVSILCTGDELRAPESPDRPGTIPESNSVALAAFCRRAGAAVTVEPLGADSLAETAKLIEDALRRSDLLITVGGASVGDYDVVRPALEACGVSLHFHKVNIRPGKPIMYGQRAAAHVLGLPGNPTSAQVTLILFGLPLLRALQGDSLLRPAWRSAELAAPIRQKTGRHGFVRAWLEGERVTPLANQASGALLSMARANALVHVPAELNGYGAGERVRALAFADL